MAKAERRREIKRGRKERGARRETEESRRGKKTDGSGEGRAGAGWLICALRTDGAPSDPLLFPRLVLRGGLQSPWERAEAAQQ